MARYFLKDTRAGRVCRVGNGSPQTNVTERKGTLYVDIGSATFKPKRNSHPGPFIVIDEGDPNGVREELEGTFYLDIADNTIGATHHLYVNTDGGTTWSSLLSKVYININGQAHGWVLIS